MRKHFEWIMNKSKNLLKKLVKKIIPEEVVADHERRCGVVRQDVFLDYIKGYKALNDSACDASGCFIEVRNVSEGTFNLLNDSEVFSIEYVEDEVIRNDLHNYFIERRFAGSDLYPHYSLGSFLTQVANSLITIGRTFYELGWETKTLSGSDYVLPTDIHYLPTSTMSPKWKKNKIVKYVQKYSWITYLFSKEFRDYDGTKPERKIIFGPDKILHFEYFEEKTPVQKALPYMKGSKRFNINSLNLSKANAHPEDKGLSLSLARGRSIKESQERYYLDQALVRKQFNYFIAGSQFDYYNSGGLKTTQYYDIFLVMRYLKYKNKLRAHIVETFNNQILKRVAEKNDFSGVPKLVCNGYTNDQELDEIFDRYKSGEISHSEVVKYLEEQNV